MPRVNEKSARNPQWNELRQAARVEAARQNKTLRQILSEALEEYLASRGGKGP